MADDSDLQTITVSGIPRELLAEIETLAAAEDRNRSNFIVKTIKDAVRQARRNRQRKPSAH